MDSETLDRLLMDRALDALDPDVASLLDAYLRKEPALAAAAEQTDAAVRLARQVLRQPRALPLPPLKIVPPAVADARPRANWLYAMAACFAAGLLAGLLVLRAGLTPPPHTPAVAQTRSASVAASVPSGFWSTQSPRPTGGGTTPTASARLLWDSPVRKPSLIPNS